MVCWYSYWKDEMKVSVIEKGILKEDCCANPVSLRRRIGDRYTRRMNVYRCGIYLPIN